MKRILLICSVAALLFSCGRVKAPVGVSFPEPPVEIVANQDFGMQLINMFNIIRIPDGTYRMYFIPYRMVGSQWIGEKMWERGLFLWKSKDGLEFTDRKMLYDKLHDTQNVMIPRGKRLKLYSRLTQERYRNRRMTVAEFDMQGNQITDTEILAGDFLYNTAACKVDERYDLLFPTYYNTHGGTTDTCTFRCYVTDGPFIRQLPCELNRWVEPDEHWVLAAPGFVFIDGERYLAYNTRTRSHETSATGMVSKYKLIKAVLEY